MTTTVKVSVHCSDDKEVVVSQDENGRGLPVTILQNGAVQEFYAYPGKTVNVTERVKE
jgi:hypothetical protein